MKEVFDNEMKLEFISKSSNEAFASSVAYWASFNAIASLFHQFIRPFIAATNKAIAAIINAITIAAFIWTLLVSLRVLLYFF